MVKQAVVKGKTIDSFFKRKRADCEDHEPELATELVPEPAPETAPETGAVPEPEPATEQTPVQPPLLLLEFGNQTHEEQGHQAHTNDTNEVVFHGVEFLERDPGLRPQIWQYPHNQRDEVRRAYLKLGPMQPLLENYKASGTQGHQRRFKYNWFGMFPSWLEYSESRDRAYCLFCFLSGKNKNKRGGSDVFTVHGFSKWKKVNNGRKCAFLNHIGYEPCSEHNNATKACQDLLNRQETYGLEQQLKHFVVDASNDEELKNVATLTNICRCLVESGRHSIYNLIDRLLRLLVTLPVSTKSVERAFSTLKIIKTRLRNKMEDEFLANSLLVNIEREITEKFSYDDVLDHFTAAKRRRADL